MLKVSLIIFALYAFSYLEALPSELCKVPPKQRHCMIEYSARQRWPHTVRYVFNWYMSTCYEIRWSHHCNKVPDPPTENNFSTQQECLKECSGWA